MDELVKDGYEVCVLDNLLTGRVENIKQHLGNANFHFVESDLRDKQAVDEAVRGVDAVFHLAAITSVPYSIKSPDVTHEVNVTGTMNLLEASLRSDVERFIYMSTCAVYGEAEYLPVD